MRCSSRVIIAVALIGALASPVAVYAQGQPDKAGRETARAARKIEQAAAKQERKANKVAEKAVRKAAKVGTETAAAAGEATESVEATPAPKLRGIQNALFHIQANIQRAMARVTSGTADAAPSGLLSVFRKFSAWLGIDSPSIPVATVDPSADPAGESTLTVEPTMTVEPTTTVAPPPPVDSPAQPVQ